MHGVNSTIYRWRGLWFVLWLVLLSMAVWEVVAHELNMWPYIPAVALTELFHRFNPGDFFEWTGLSYVFGYELYSGGLVGRSFNVMYVVAALLVTLVYTICMWTFTYSPRIIRQLPALRPLSWWQRIVAAWMAALLVTAAAWLVMDETNLWQDVYGWFSSTSYSQPQLSNVRWQYFGVPNLWWAGPAMLGVAFAGCLVLFLRARSEDDRYWKLERLTRRFALAALAIWVWTGVHAWFGEAEDVYEDGYTAGVLCTFVLLWAVGVRALLLLQLRRYERVRDDTDEPICFACGYDLRGSLPAGAVSCPECGTPIAKRLLDRAEVSG